jgi:hypothetical protein
MVVITALINMGMNTTNFNSFLYLDKVEALGVPEFVIKFNGNVGIFNDNPGSALEIGTNSHLCAAYIHGLWLSSSDSRIKENIKDLSNSLDIVGRLRGVSYNFKGRTAGEAFPAGLISGKSEEEAAKLKEEWESACTIVPSLKGREIYGFIAEEVREVLPNLVYEDSVGMLSMDYNGILPVLVSAIQELRQQVDELRSLQKPSVSRSSGNATDVIEISTQAAVLYQNTPNPFKEKTEIRYSLSEEINTAEIYVFDMQGKLLKKYSADKSGVVVIKGSDLKAGIYLYSLIVDGKQIDTKRMILTK